MSSVFISNTCAEECERAARGVGLSTEAWIEAMLFRVARMQGVPPGVIDPSFIPGQGKPSPDERIATALESLARAAIAFERIADAVELPEPK